MADKKEILKLLVTFLVFMFVMIGFSVVFGFAGKGFDTTHTKDLLNVYGVFGIAMLVGLTGAGFYSFYKGDDRYGTSIAFTSPGESPAVPGSFFKKTFRTFLIFTIFFTILGVTALYKAPQNTFFFGIADLEQQQFTPVQNVIYNATLVVPAENLGGYFFLALTILSLKYICRRYNVSKSGYVLMVYFFGIFVFALYGFLNHLLRYGSNDGDLLVVVVIWALQGLLTIVVGNWMPALLLHESNNVFGSLKEIYPSVDLITLWSVGFVILLTVILGYTTFYARRKHEPQQ